MTTRRNFLLAGAAVSAGASLLHARRGARIKIGVTDWNLRQEAKIEAVALAGSLDFDGVQVSLGKDRGDGKLKLDDPDLQRKYVAEAKARNIEICSTCLEILHVNWLKSDQLGRKWVSDGIRATRGLGTKVMLLPFFGKGALNTAEEKNYVGDVLRDLGPEAEKAGVILALENTISADDNLRIMERSRSKAVRVYYDVGNSTHNKFDILREIRALGRANICQVHIKDNPHYLGEGSIDFPAVFKALNDIDYDGYAVLETDAPSKSVEADMKRNLAFVRRVMSDAKV